MKIFAACLLTTIPFICSACIFVADNDTYISTWKRYANEENHFRFNYPNDWEVIDDGFYKTHYGVTIQKINQREDSDSWIRINSPQFSMENGRCIAVNDQQICTYSNDEIVIDIFQKIATSFTCECD